MTTPKNRAFWKVSGGLAGLAFLLASLVAANIIVGRFRVRADLTEEKLYTLSDGTRQVLQKLEKPVTLKLFFSRSSTDVPANIKAYARQVEDVLREYRIAGGAKIKVQILDPKPDSEAEEWAQSYGVAPQNVDMLSPPIYFGLAAVSGETEGAIPAFDPRTDSLLEYNITRLIYRVGHPQRPVVGVMSSLPVLGEAPDPQSFGMPPANAAKPWLSFHELQNDYTLRAVDPKGNTIPEDIQALVLVHPKNLSNETLYALDQFVLRGGHLLAFLDPFCVADLESGERNPYGPPDAASNIAPLLTAWGINYSADQVVADTKAVSRLRTSDNRVEESPVFLTLHSDNVNRGDILTAQLGMIMLPFAGIFGGQGAEGLKVTPLLMSSDLSGPVSTMSAQMGAAAINRDFKPTGTPQNMAIRLSGNFKTAFPDGKPKPTPAEGETTPPPTEPDTTSLKEGNGTVILVGDVDMLFDRFCVEELNFFGTKAAQPLNDNLNFFANAVEQIAGSTDLIGIRSRGEFFRPFERVQALEQKARTQWQEKEKTLVAKLQEAREQLSQLQTKKDEGQKFILSTEQQEAIARYRDEELRISKELKDVRKNLRSEIERLGFKVKLANIVLMPLLIGIGGVCYGVRRRRPN